MRGKTLRAPDNEGFKFDEQLDMFGKHCEMLGVPVIAVIAVIVVRRWVR
jgi:hypothetical protein